MGPHLAVSPFGTFRLFPTLGSHHGASGNISGHKALGDRSGSHTPQRVFVTIRQGGQPRPTLLPSERFTVSSCKS